MPEKSSAIDFVKAHGLLVQTLPMLELRRNVLVVLHYPLRLLVNAARLVTIVQSEGAIALVMNDYYNLLGACVKMRMPNLHMLTFVRFLPSTMPTLLNKLWIAAALRYANSVVAVSDAVRLQLPRVCKVKLLYNAVQFAEYHSPYQVRNCTSTVELLYLGNYIRGKGQDYALRAFELAYHKDKRLRLTFMGGTMGLAKNEAFKTDLERYAADAGLTEVTVFLPFADDVESAYKSADIFLNFSEAESFSMTCAEASYYGVPTIASRCGGPEEIIVDELTGMLRPNRDVAAFAAAMVSLAGNTSLRQAFSGQCRNHVRKKFSCREFREKLIQLLPLPLPLTIVDVPE
ncbi:hypothetical protein BUE76_19900 [Cnuella takakiae]|nr:hypothetical protein BUE76_19900 [Cnuella takakiae]